MRCRGYIGARSWLTEANATVTAVLPLRQASYVDFATLRAATLVRRRFLCAP